MPITVSQKICSKCKVPKDASEYWENPRYRSGLQSYCKKCLSEASMKQKKSDPGKMVAKLRMVRYRLKNLDKSRARGAMRSKIKNGMIFRPIQCQKCGGSEGKIEAHHHEGYSRENRFNVQWLCKPCHREADKFSG